MTAVIVPYSYHQIDLLGQSADFHSEFLAKNRATLLKELRCISGIPEIARSLNPDTVYKLVSTPKGATLFKNSAGNIKGVFYKDGKIIEHAKFNAITPSLIKAASAIGTQVLLISIAMQLNRIENGISRILEELHNDRIAEITSGINQFRQAMLVNESGRRERLIELAIQTLNSGITKTTISLKNQIEAAPSDEVGFFDNWGKNKSHIAKEKMALAEESFQACLLGIKTLSECFSIINEPNAAASSLAMNIASLKSSGIDVAARKARLIPATADRFPENPWTLFLKNEQEILNDVHKCNSLGDNSIESIEIDLKPSELIGE